MKHVFWSEEDHALIVAPLPGGGVSIVDCVGLKAGDDREGKRYQIVLKDKDAILVAAAINRYAGENN